VKDGWLVVRAGSAARVSRVASVEDGESPAPREQGQGERTSRLLHAAPLGIAHARQNIASNDGHRFGVARRSLYS
jgi:hypothetical protein